MPASFYDNPKTGRLHFRAPAGGGGDQATGMFDVPATPQLIEQYKQEYADYLRAAAGKGDKPEERETYILQLETSLAAARAHIERLIAEVAAKEAQIVRLQAALPRDSAA